MPKKKLLFKVTVKELLRVPRVVAFQRRHDSRRSSQNEIIIFGCIPPGKCHWHLSQKSGTLSHYVYQNTSHSQVFLDFRQEKPVDVMCGVL